MWRWGAGILAGLVILAALSWQMGRLSVEAPEPQTPPVREPAESPPTSRPPNPDPMLVPGVGSRTIERETVREGDDDDDDSDTRIIVTPRQTSQPRPSATRPRPTQAPTTRPPLLPDVNIPTELPKLPDTPRMVPELPLRAGQK